MAETAYDQAIKYISMRSHTVFELKNKLKRKKFDKKEIEEALERLVEQKYLNDHDFAQTFTQNLIKYKSFGYYGIKNKLRQRGISDHMAEEILAEELDLKQEKMIAQKLLGKSSQRDKLKLMQMLNRKGFRTQIISELVGGWSE
jgi:regulatory protein